MLLSNISYLIIRVQQPSKMKPVIVGVDIGSYTFKICTYHEKTFQILVNQANFRETPSVVSFTQAERLVGQEAVNKLKSNYMNTIKSPMRLIGLDKSYELVQEELKNTTCKFEIEDQLTFTLVDQKRKSVEPEEILTALMTKVKKIITEHRLKAQILYLTVPSYLSQYERKIIKKCAEISQISHKTHIIEDWISIATEYSYTRTKQLKNSPSSRIVLIADIGHSKISLFVMEFNQTQMRLLDSQHLRFLGAKNMDHLIAQFYEGEIKKQRRSNQSIFSMPKACIKLYDQIQKQRKVLSANTEHQLHVESLIQDDDFSYTMKRVQLQRIIGPVLDDINITLVKLKSRMPESIKLHSIELIGGASRIPIFRTIIQQIFGVEPSKTLNQSEALALGTAIYGAKEAGLHVLDYNIINVNLVDIFACWSYSGSGNFLGQNDALYKHRQIIFSSSCKVPSENIISFGNEGPVEMFIYYGQSTSRKAIGYVRFSTPNKIRFLIDSDKILQATVDIGNFQVYKFSDKKEKKWLQLQKRQKQLYQSQERLKQIYKLKNQYQSQLYGLKNRLFGFKEILNQIQMKMIDEQLKKVESWLENQHTRVLGSEQDFNLYIIKLQEIKTSVFLQNLQQRKKSIQFLVRKYQIVKSQAEKATLAAKNELQARKLHFLLRWLVQSFQNMKQTKWEGYYLTQSSLQFAIQQLSRISKM